jgi:hypothetical protein
MKKEEIGQCRTLWQNALFIAAPFVLVHLAGFRTHTSVLAGTNSGGIWAHAAGSAYLVLYVLAVYLAPIFAIAGLMLWMEERAERTWWKND